MAASCCGVLWGRIEHSKQEEEVVEETTHLIMMVCGGNQLFELGLVEIPGIFMWKWGHVTSDPTSLRYSWQLLEDPLFWPLEMTSALSLLFLWLSQNTRLVCQGGSNFVPP